MIGLRNSVIAIGLLAISAPAGAQVTSPPSTASLVASSALKSPMKEARNANPAARWMCAGGVEMEVRPVSYDVATAKSDDWVVVYKRDGKAYSAERVGRAEAASIPVNDCQRDGRVG